MPTTFFPNTSIIISRIEFVESEKMDRNREINEWGWKNRCSLRKTEWNNDENRQRYSIEDRLGGERSEAKDRFGNRG